jgi:hypothetical protein
MPRESGERVRKWTAARLPNDDGDVEGGERRSRRKRRDVEERLMIAADVYSRYSCICMSFDIPLLLRRGLDLTLI